MVQLKDVSKTAHTYLGDKYVDPHADAIAKHQIGLRVVGIVEQMPVQMVSKKPGDVEMVDEKGNPFDHLRGRDSLVSKLEAYITANGGDYRTVTRWMMGQAGSSWDDAPQALKYELAQARGGNLGDYFWKNGEDEARRHHADAVAKAGGIERYRASFHAFQSFTREYLTKADFPGKNADGTVTVKRTESYVAMSAAGMKPGDVSDRIRRGAAESTSLVKWFSLMGNEKTTQRVPIHRVLGTYWQSREAGGYGGAFAGDHENEFVCLLEGVKVTYLKRK